MKITNIRLVQCDRLRGGGLELAVAVEVTFDGTMSAIGIDTAATPAEIDKAVHNCIKKAQQLAAEWHIGESVLEGAFFSAVEMAGKQAIINAKGTTNFEALEAIADDTLQAKVNEVCDELGIPYIRVAGIRNVAETYCMVNALKSQLKEVRNELTAEGQ